MSLVKDRFMTVDFDYITVLKSITSCLVHFNLTILSLCYNGMLNGFSFQRQLQIKQTVSTLMV